MCKKYVISKFTKDLLFNFSTSFKVQYNCIWPLANLLLWPYVFFPTLAKKLFFLFKLPCLKSSNWDNAESKWAFSRTALSQLLQNVQKLYLPYNVRVRYIQDGYNKYSNANIYDVNCENISKTNTIMTHIWRFESKLTTSPNMFFFRTLMTEHSKFVN